ncbi:hypothetical protein BGZ94_002003 [Podila epigama]|nr:hypothetical protein BGZ94_002003 [Podila epigama]
MASPPSSFQSSHEQPTPIATNQPNEHQSSSSTQGSSQKKRTVPDGYIYQSYEDHGARTSDKHEDELAQQGQQASATRILELRGLERRIVQLLKTAGEAIQILSGDQDEDEQDPEVGKRLLASVGKSREEQQVMTQAYADEKAQKFEVLASSYATLVNEIQSGLRRQFHYLTKAGITSSHVPFKNVLYGEEKELETWLNAVEVLSNSANSLIGKIENEFEIKST